MTSASSEPQNKEHRFDVLNQSDLDQAGEEHSAARLAASWNARLGRRVAFSDQLIEALSKELKDTVPPADTLQLFADPKNAAP